MADDEAPDRAVEELEGYGLEEGEVETMESKWVTWSFDVEENKGLVLDEVWAPPTPGELAGRSLLRARRRDYFGERVVGASPVFYGVVVAVLAPIAARPCTKQSSTNTDLTLQPCLRRRSGICL